MADTDSTDHPDVGARRKQRGQRKDPVSRDRIRRMVAFDAELYELLDNTADANGISFQWLVHILLRRSLNIRENGDSRIDINLKVER